MNKWLRKGVKHSLPIAAGYFTVAIPFGMACVNHGLTPLQGMLLSLTNLTSAGQFAALPQIAAGAGLIQVVLTQLIINLRFGLMSLSLSPRMGPDMTTLHRMLFAFSSTDEIFGIASAQPEKLRRHYLYGLALLPWLCWGLGAWLGALAGEMLPERAIQAMNISMYALFLAIMLPPARHHRPVLLVVLLSAVISTVCSAVGVSGSAAVILCAVIASAAGAWLFPIKQQEERRHGE